MTRPLHKVILYFLIVFGLVTPSFMYAYAQNPIAVVGSIGTAISVNPVAILSTSSTSTPKTFTTLFTSLGRDFSKKKNISVIGTVTAVEHDFFTLSVKNKKDLDSFLVLSMASTSIELFENRASTTPLSTILSIGDRLLVLGTPMLKESIRATSTVNTEVASVDVDEGTYLQAKEITFLGETKQAKKNKINQMNGHTASRASVATEAALNTTKEEKPLIDLKFWKWFDKEDTKEIKEDIRETSR